MRTGGIRVERIRIGGIRFEWICVGYVWCDGYVWNMSGVRYANNLLKNRATKRLSEKTHCCFFFRLNMLTEHHGNGFAGKRRM